MTPGLDVEQRIRLMKMAFQACQDRPRENGEDEIDFIVSAYDRMVEAVLEQPAEGRIDWTGKLLALEAHYGSAEKAADQVGVSRVGFWRFKRRGIGLQKFRDRVNKLYGAICPVLQEDTKGSAVDWRDHTDLTRKMPAFSASIRRESIL